MEQVRVILAWITKHHFWLLSGLAVLISTLVWYLAAGDLAARKETNRKSIDAAFSAQQQIVSRPMHPNDEVNQRQQQEITKLAEETKTIWQELYDRQRKDVLKWPSQLPEMFRRDVEKKQFGDEISVDRRAQYGDYIRGRFKDLPKLIEANELIEEGPGALRTGTAGFSGGRGSSGGGGAGGFSNTTEVQLDEQGNPIEIEYTVLWERADQERIRKDLDWPTTQSHWRIWVTQEDLWVYETMLRAIAETNKSVGADRQSNAAITNIAALQVGRDAAKESRTKGRIKRLQSASSSLDGEEEASPEEGTGEEEMTEEFSGDTSTGEALSNAEEKAVRLSRRYVDAEGKAIAVAPDDLPLDAATFGQEVKRLPVRLVLRMDTRAIAKLQSELANADLQIQVTELRVGDNLGNSSGGGGYSGSESGGGGFGAGGGGFGGKVNNEQINVFERNPHMKTVIIQGIVLIFNPPNSAVLEGGSSEEPASDAGFASQ